MSSNKSISNSRLPGDSRTLKGAEGSSDTRSAIDIVLNEIFGFPKFRSRQREVCLSAWRGNDALLVMPTGAGKSLCYQIPTIARQEGRALVISPLIALIEDQVRKLQELGLLADRIHSGRSRAESLDSCRKWREGQSQFLFVAPERLGVPGFLEFLEENLPSVIAVDEAHCISIWGHDFRSEYRQLGSRLNRLRPANIIALTATATPEVQKDIVAQLHLTNPDVFIHGFRRDNIAIELIELTPGSRLDAVIEILKSTERLPCIVYAPTRKVAESMAKDLREHHRCGVFHAGMPPQDRQYIQDLFIGGELDIIVATIAFGMGIDKSNIRTVIHVALPSSLEAYYQEIGRAGRDGNLSSAVLMYAPIDRKTHDYFLEQNYPDLNLLDKIIDAIRAGSTSRDEIANRLSLPPDQIRLGLEKLWIHEGISIENDGSIMVGKRGWEKRYLKQRNHRINQLNDVMVFANHKGCRMLRLIEYFGDREDALEKCGICDRCRGPQVAVPSLKTMKTGDAKGQQELLQMLLPFHSKTLGQVYKETFEPKGWDRRRFDGIAWALESTGMIYFSKQSFVKNGETIEFQRIGLTKAGRSWLHEQKLAPPVAAQIASLDKRASKSRHRASKRSTQSKQSYNERRW